MARSRQFAESPYLMGADEKIPFNFDVSTWSTTPITPSVALYDITDGAYTDVTSTNLTGSATIADTTITTPYVYNLTAGKKYRLEAKWYDGASILEGYCVIDCER